MSDYPNEVYALLAYLADKPPMEELPKGALIFRRAVVPESLMDAWWWAKADGLVKPHSRLLTGKGRMVLRAWRESTETPRETTNAPTPKKRTGRPRKGDSDGATIVLAALVAHHEYEPGGSIGNWEPIGNNKLAARYDVSTAAASRFFKDKFGSHKAYQVACRRKEIGRTLAKLQGDEASRFDGFEESPFDDDSR